MEILEGLRDDAGRPKPDALRQAAAMLGPGYKGSRANITDGAWQQKADEIRQMWSDAGLGDVPGYLKSRTEWKDRRAKLFEIGEYDDKGLKVTTSDLQSLAGNFDAPAPILVEHVDNPLRLGYLTQVEAIGDELFGLLALTPEADDLLESSGAKSLSVSVSRDMKRIFEVSIVGNPRVESARLFCGDFRDYLPHPSLSHRERESGGQQFAWKEEALRLRSELEQKDVRDAVEQFVRSGAILPASREAAEQLLKSARGAGIESAAVAFFESLPERKLFGEIAPQPKKSHSLGSDEAEFYRKHFPDIPVDEIAKRKEDAWQR